VDYVFRDKTSPSGVALIFVAKDGENSIAVVSGANAKLSPADVRRARSAFTCNDVLIMQLETPLKTVQTAADIAFKTGMRVILNPAPARPLPDRLLKRISILTPNESEAELLTGIAVNSEASAAKAAAKLRARGVSTVIVTLGTHGAFVSTADFCGCIKGFKVKAVDTTAAGDVFNGALAVGLAEGHSIVEAVHFAHAAAAISVTRLGAQTSVPTRKDIEKFLMTAKKQAIRGVLS